MIQITLNFNSVEAARAALLDIPASAFAAQVPVAEAVAPKSVQAPAPAAGQATAKESAAPKKTAAAPAPSAPSVETAAPVSTAVDYATLQKAVFILAGKNREAAAQVAGSFEVKTFKELPEDKWAAALVAVNAKIAELEAA